MVFFFAWFYTDWFFEPFITWCLVWAKSPFERPLFDFLWFTFYKMWLGLESYLIDTHATSSYIYVYCRESTQPVKIDYVSSNNFTLEPGIIISRGTSVPILVEKLGLQVYYKLFLELRKLHNVNEFSHV